MSWSTKPLKRPLVLAVDDEDVVLRFMQEVLEAGGYRVVTARHSVEALEKAAEIRETIDVLLTDYDMRIFQNGSGLAACIRVLRPETRILITSASCLPDGALPADSGWEFLVKPFTHGDLLHRVDGLIGFHRQVRHWELPCLV